ncbi:MAG: hypothetical protein SFX73_10860 [Kofleriaceae bacterium]|nr:hypothetical protein [Kofleriaceae bacterium]
MSSPRTAALPALLVSLLLACDDERAAPVELPADPPPPTFEAESAGTSSPGDVWRLTVSPRNPLDPRVLDFRLTTDRGTPGAYGDDITLIGTGTLHVEELPSGPNAEHYEMVVETAMGPNAEAVAPVGARLRGLILPDLMSVVALPRGTVVTSLGQGACPPPVGDHYFLPTAFGATSLGPNPYNAPGLWSFFRARVSGTASDLDIKLGFDSYFETSDDAASAAQGVDIVNLGCQGSPSVAISSPASRANLAPAPSTAELTTSSGWNGGMMIDLGKGFGGGITIPVGKAFPRTADEQAWLGRTLRQRWMYGIRHRTQLATSSSGTQIVVEDAAYVSLAMKAFGSEPARMQVRDPSTLAVRESDLPVMFYPTESKSPGFFGGVLGEPGTTTGILFAFGVRHGQALSIVASAIEGGGLPMPTDATPVGAAVSTFYVRLSPPPACSLEEAIGMCSVSTDHGDDANVKIDAPQGANAFSERCAFVKVGTRLTVEAPAGFTVQQACGPAYLVPEDSDGGFADEPVPAAGVYTLRAGDGRELVIVAR